MDTTLSTTTDLAWTIPVCPLQLGSHLEAYVRSRPIVNTLRLANRFGQGPKATITRLPIELIEHIESFIAQDARACWRDEWLKDYDCWRDNCSITDHIDEDELMRIYNEDRHDYRRDEEYEVREHVKRYCEAYLGYCDAIDLDRQYGWREDHNIFIDDWFERTKELDHRKMLGAFLLKDFGLKVWIGHSDYECEDEGDARHGKTEAYLCLPGAWQDWDNFNCSYGRNYQGERKIMDTKEARAVVPTIPEKPSEKKLKRFEQAVKALGLSVKLELPGEDDDDDNEEEKKKKDDVVRPLLRLLTQTEVHGG